jgi:hypothetical protein
MYLMKYYSFQTKCPEREVKKLFEKLVSSKIQKCFSIKVLSSNDLKLLFCDFWFYCYSL